MDVTQQVISFLKEEEFDKCIDFLENDEIDILELLKELNIFSDKKKKWEFRKAFWKSKLPLHIFNKSSKSHLEKRLIATLFRLKHPPNFDFSLKLWQENERLFKSCFKRFSCYEEESWIELLKEISSSLLRHKRFSINMLIAESEYLRDLDLSLDEEQKQDQEIVSKIPLDKLLLGTCCYHDQMMQNPIIINNKTLQTQLDMAIVREFNEILNYFINKNLELNQTSISNSELQSNWEQYRPNHKTENSKERQSSENPELKKLYEIFEKGVERQRKRFVKDAYLAGYGDFDPLDEISTSIKYNSDYKRFSLNNSKNQLEELYFLFKHANYNLDRLFGDNKHKLHSTLNPNANGEMAIKAWLTILDFYQIPLSIPNTNINLELVIKILWQFSNYKAPESWFFVNNQKARKMNPPPERFTTLFGPEEAISVFNYSELIKNLASYFKYPPEVVQETLDFLIFDLNSNDKQQDFLFRPFIKLNNQVFWLGRLLKNRRWDVILRNKLKEDKLYPKTKYFTERIDKNLEQTIGQLLLEQGFKTKVGLDFPHPDNPKNIGGDIDVLAYKDHHLFVIQVKNAIYRDQITNATYIEDTRIENEAVEQIDKSLFYVKNNWPEVCAKLDIEVSQSDAEIVPLIITNVFEGDAKTYKGYLKTSLFELLVILKNEKGFMYNTMLFTQFSNAMNPDFKEMQKLSDTALDLWDGKKELEVQTLIRNVKENVVWDFL